MGGGGEGGGDGLRNVADCKRKNAEEKRDLLTGISCCSPKADVTINGGVKEVSSVYSHSRFPTEDAGKEGKISPNKQTTSVTFCLPREA